MSRSSDKSARAAGNLAKRFMKGGDLHGGNEKVSPTSLKGSFLLGRNDNIRDKDCFRNSNDRAKAGFFDGSRHSEKRNKQESTNAR